MKPLMLLLLFVSSQCIAQKTPPQSTGKAVTKGDCSPSVTGSNNNFRFSCGVGKEQGEQIIALLNQLLASNDTSQVIVKLNEILKRTNPNGTVTTYDCQGNMRQVTESTGRHLASAGRPYEFLQPMIDLYNANRFSELLNACLVQIQLKSEWLTPRLLCGTAYQAMGDHVNAKKMLDEYDANVGPAYDDEACRFFSTQLRSNLK
jgi:hypothetical protein